MTVRATRPVGNWLDNQEFMIKTPLSAPALSNFLYYLDPMHTCCVENECVDEYDRLARSVMERFSAGRPLRQSLIDECRIWFKSEPSENTLDALQRRFSG
jgi:hypothetical protein